MEHVPEERFETVRDVLEAAQQRLRELGHGDTWIIDPGAEALVSLVGGHVVAHVDPGAAQTGLARVQQLAGQAAVDGKIGAVFSIGGFTDEAIAWAERTGVALFLFDPEGTAEPVGRFAADAVARVTAAGDPPELGELAEPVELAALLADGLVGGPVTEVGLWYGAAGQVLTFWLEPGDRDRPASVVVDVYPGALGQPERGLPVGWEQATRHPPGGGHERVWTRGFVHANQPPTAIAGDAVLGAVDALEAFGATLERCRVEVRPPVDLEESEIADAEAARMTVLGPPGPQEPYSLAPDTVDDAARVVTALVDRQRRHGPGALVEGLAEDGRIAWRLVAGQATPGESGQRHAVEAHLAEPLLQAQTPRRLFRKPEVTMGGARWHLAQGFWRTSAEGPDLETAAHEAVMHLVAAYAAAGADFEATALRTDV